MQSIAKKPAETVINKKLLEMKQRALKSPGRWERLSTRRCRFRISGVHFRSLVFAERLPSEKYF